MDPEPDTRGCVDAAALQAIRTARRRRILHLVWDVERPAGDIAAQLDVSWPAVSQNLRVLHEAGLITVRRQGTHRLYRANRSAMGPLIPLLEEMWRRDLDRLAEEAEAQEAEAQEGEAQEGPA